MTRAVPIPDTVTLHVPFHVVKRGGRKEMQMPDGTAQLRGTDNALVKALARAFRWKRMLESGEFTTIAELAEREGIAPSYMTRVLRLTLLSPDIVGAILDGTHGSEVTLAQVLEPFSMDWTKQVAPCRQTCQQIGAPPIGPTQMGNCGRHIKAATDNNSGTTHSKEYRPN